MKQFLAFVKKEFLYIFRDTWTMIILLLLPILMVVLFGFGITTEIKHTHVAVFDPSRDMATQNIVNRLSESEYFIVDKHLSDISEVESVLKKGDYGMVVVFSENFNENMSRGTAQVQLIVDGSDPNIASQLSNFATAIINQLAIENAGTNVEAGFKPTPTINCQLKLLYNPTMKGAYSTVPGVLGLVLMLICTMMTSISIAREKEMGTMEALLVSPVKPFTIILSKTVPYFVLSLVNLATVLSLSVFVLQVPIVGSFWLLIGLSLLFIFLCLCLGVLISIVAPSQIVAMLVSAVVMMLPTMMLSGLMFPVENLPLILKWFAQIIPAKWFIEAARNVMIKGADISAISAELLILSSAAAMFLAVSMKMFKIRLN